MKILVPKTSVPIWGIILGFTCTSLASLLFIAINIYISIAMFVFLNGITWLVIKMAINFDKWKKSTLEKDSFFKQSNFSLGSYSQFSLLAVSCSIVRIVNIKSTIQVHRTNYDISEVYKNYPRQGIDIVLNGMNVYHFDIPIATIKSAEPILQGDAGGFGVLNSLNFGVRITTIKEEIFDVDTPFQKNFVMRLINLLVVSTNSFIKY